MLLESTTKPTRLHHTPRFDTSGAERLAHEHFGMAGRATTLASERDQNFMIEDARGGRIVLKVANGDEDRAIIEAQQRALTFLAQRLDTTPRVLSMLNGATIAEAEGHLVWATSWMGGVALGASRRRSSALDEDFGRQIGVLQRELAGFDHSAVHRDFHWDLANARSIVGAKRSLIADAGLRAAIDRIIREIDRVVVPRLDALPRAIIHGDLNDYNVLIDGESVTGIIDFGDMVYSYRVADLAIAVAYAMLDPDDPLGVAAAMVRGYSKASSLTDDELAVLYGLALLRLCLSACIAAEQRAERPDNEYLGISQLAIIRTLPKLAAIPFGLAEVTLRAAAGVDPSPASARVRRFLERVSVAPVLGIDLTREPSIVLDLSVASPLLSGDRRENDEPRLTERVFDEMARASVNVSIGRYDEPRLLYVAPAFATGPNVTDEHRTIHIGLDLFAKAGKPVYAPLAATVHAFADNAQSQDYGPVIILRHQADDGTEFFTLYGHLSRESLAGLKIGQEVNAGDQIATLGTEDVNGGWTPHLHLQIIIDLLELGTDFPGVARPSQRAAWTTLCPDPNLLVRVPAERFPVVARSKATTLAARQERIGHNLSIAYRDPVKIVRGWMQYLYDDEGRQFIDAYNNVPHVGHAHPRVVEAGAAQMRLLNTNTRYLNDLLTAYAERLLETLPKPLEVCYFVNSASEANELALRLARAYTGARDTIVLEAAYHGNTTSLIDISPYKHAGPGGKGAPEWVHVAPLPDDYRGPFKRSDPDAGHKYAASVGQIVDRLRGERKRIAAFIAETCPSVGGQLILPPGYLAAVYDHVRRAGGVTIADEVQTGLGRMGTSMWAFQDHHVVPDIVVMGKPLGNGHPIGAVATTKAIAESFDNGMEYFSTFGGNTVSCAIGLAVLDVLRDERLMNHGRVVGDRMLAGLGLLMNRHPIVGDVRGSGLFLGVELVRDRASLEPATAEASYVANRMRELGVLLGTDGPHHNVVKIRPPMPFSATDADLLVESLDRVLGELTE